MGACTEWRVGAAREPPCWGTQAVCPYGRLRRRRDERRRSYVFSDLRKGDPDGCSAVQFLSLAEA